MPSKYHQLAAVIRQALRDGQYSRADKLPTELELSGRYHVSRQTVRHALALLVEEGLIEKQQGSGTRVRQSGSGTRSKVAVLTPDGIQTATELMEVQSVLSRYGYEMECFATEKRQSTERRVLQQVCTMNVAGVLAEGVCSALPNANTDLYAQLERTGVPVVFLRGGCLRLPEQICISDDNEGGGYQLTNYLIGTGHRRIAALMRSDEQPGAERYYGYVCALRDGGVPLPDESIFWYSQADVKSLRQFDPKMYELIAQRLEGCTAAVCYDDELAELLLQAIQQGRLTMPETLTVVGFDDSNKPLPVPFTRLTRSAGQLGAVAAEQLCLRMQGKPAQSSKLPWELVKKNRH